MYIHNMPMVNTKWVSIETYENKLRRFTKTRGPGRRDLICLFENQNRVSAISFYIFGCKITLRTQFGNVNEYFCAFIERSTTVPSFYFYHKIMHLCMSSTNIFFARKSETSSSVHNIAKISSLDVSFNFIGLISRVCINFKRKVYSTNWSSKIIWTNYKTWYNIYGKLMLLLFFKNK